MEVPDKHLIKIDSQFCMHIWRYILSRTISALGQRPKCWAKCPAKKPCEGGSMKGAWHPDILVLLNLHKKECMFYKAFSQSKSAHFQ